MNNAINTATVNTTSAAYNNGTAHKALGAIATVEVEGHGSSLIHPA